MCSEPASTVRARWCAYRPIFLYDDSERTYYVRPFSVSKTIIVMQPQRALCNWKLILSGKPERKAQSSFEYLSAVAICYFSFAKCDISVCTKIVFCGKVMHPRTQFMMVNCISRNLQYSVIFALNSSRSIAFSLSYPVSWTDNSQRVRSQRPWFL